MSALIYSGYQRRVFDPYRNLQLFPSVLAEVPHPFRGSLAVLPCSASSDHVRLRWIDSTNAVARKVNV